MLIIMGANTHENANLQVMNMLEQAGITGYPVNSGKRRLICLGQNLPEQLHENLLELSTVEKIMPIKTPYKLASREYRPQNSRVVVGNRVSVGDGNFVVMAGPCTIESEEQLFSTAAAVKKAGAHILRGGAFKPRTSPYSFQGMGIEGLRLLRQAGNHFDLPVITEVMETAYVEDVAFYSDIIQIGARNMQNFPLLREVGRTGKAVMLKRGPSATLEEWLMAAEYVMATGNEQVILCERGIKSFDPATRNCLDLGGVVAVQEKTHLPIIIDPSHATGKRSLVPPLALAAAAAGTAGIMLECHPKPEVALCDGPQSLTFDQLYRLLQTVRQVVQALNIEEAAEFEELKVGA